MGGLFEIGEVEGLGAVGGEEDGELVRGLEACEGVVALLEGGLVGGEDEGGLHWW